MKKIGPQDLVRNVDASQLVGFSVTRFVVNKLIQINWDWKLSPEFLCLDFVPEAALTVQDSPTWLPYL